MVEKLMFVGGLPRSGSSLIMNLLGQNPRLHVTPTSDVVEMLAGLKAWFTGAAAVNAQDEVEMTARFRGALNGALYGWASAATERPVYIDKSRGWISSFELLEDIIGTKPKIIVPVRDLRGVLSSMELLFRKNVLRVDPAQNADALAALTTEGRVRLWAAKIPVGVAVDRVKDTITRKVDGHLLFVRYEDLCSDPQNTMRGIYEYIEEPFHQHDFKHVKQLTQEDDRVFGIANLHKVEAEVRPAREDWGEIIGEDFSSQLVKSVPWYYEKFYPERK